MLNLTLWFWKPWLNKSSYSLCVYGKEFSFPHDFVKTHGWPPNIYLWQERHRPSKFPVSASKKMTWAVCLHWSIRTKGLLIWFGPNLNSSTSPNPLNLACLSLHLLLNTPPWLTSGRVGGSFSHHPTPKHLALSSLIYSSLPRDKKTKQNKTKNLFSALSWQQLEISQ